jgi:single-stranded-DNA-specific exonuclease
MQQKWVVAEKVSNDIVTQLLYNRGLRDKNAIANFFNPPPPEVITTQYPTYLKKISTSQVEKAVSIIKEAVGANRPIVIHGDYDVDGLCGTAICYETLKNIGAKVVPFIPDRFDEGYGLSIDSLKKIQQLTTPQFNNETIRPLLITTDCGITAVDEIKYAKDQGFEVIITDHHTQGEQLPDADAIIWTDELAGAGVAYLFARQCNQLHLGGVTAYSNNNLVGLDLVALATIADIQPLTGVNRALVKSGLEELNSTLRVGLKELIKVSGLEGRKIGTYEVSWMLAPRLNASGRLQNAVDSLNLLITNDPLEAQNLAAKLNRVNQERQQITQQAVDAARGRVGQAGKIIILHHETWHEGVIGLVAGKIREEFYRPAVIISRGEKISKGSARSVTGFNIIEALRRSQKFLIDTGGHAMAAGFTIETTQIAQFQEHLTSIATEQLAETDLTPTLKIDIEVRLEELDWDLMTNLKKFEPFGVGNPRPVFLTCGVKVLDVRTVGSTNQHLKLRVGTSNNVSPLRSERSASGGSNTMKQFSHFSCIGFGFGDGAAKLRPGDRMDIVYYLEEDTWNGQKYLQLKLKDLRKLELEA